MTNRNRIPVQTLDKARKALDDAYAQCKSWRKVGALYGLPAGTACAVAKGRRPSSAVARKLGILPPPRRIWERCARDVWRIIWGERPV